MTVSFTANQTKSGSSVSAAGTSHEQAFSQIAELARRASTQSKYYAEALSHAAKPFGCPFAMIEVMLFSTVVTEYYHSGPTDPGFWKPAVAKLLARSLAEKRSLCQGFDSKDSDEHIAIMSGMITDAKHEVIGAIAIVVTCDSDAQAQQYHPVLRSLTSLISACSQFVSAPGVSHGPSEQAAANESVLSQAAGYSSTSELAFAIVNNLRNRTGCDQVSLGLVDGQRVRVVAVSGFDSVNERSAAVRTVASAMAECVDLAQPIVCQKETRGSDERTSTGCRLHRQWHDSVNSAPVACVPLRVGDRVVAVVGMRRDLGEPFTEDGPERLGLLLQPYADAVDLVSRATRGVPRHMADSLAAATRAVLRPGRWTAKLMVVGMLAAVAWFCFGKMDYELTVPCTVVAAESRQFCAPWQAELREAPLLAGDRVSKGDILYVFATRQLEMEVARLEADRQVASLLKRKAMAEGKQVEASLAKASIEELQARLSIARSRLDQAVLRAPFDGVVLRGDLRRRIGEILPQGHPLYEISPSGRWILQLRVPEADVDMVVGGQSGR
ncbi:hypothetical protein LCGC14_1896640, partial [marine sediment metagenome]